MRVLHLIFSLGRGGLEKWLLSMLRHIPRREAEMDICCVGPEIGPLKDEALELGATIHHCPLGPTHIGFFRKFSAALRTGRYDLAHNHLNLYTGFPTFTARRARIPTLTTFHVTDFSEPTNRWLRIPILRSLRRGYGRVSVGYALRNSTIVSGVSKGVVESIAASREELRLKPRILYLGVPVPPPPTPEEAADFRRSLGFPPETPILLHVGRFIEQKNHHGLTAIFGKILEERPDARLILVGDGILRPDIESLVRWKGIDHAVRFLGARDDVPDIMGNSDVFVLPSRYEGLPIVSLEAQAAGLPVVGSRIPGMTEGVDEGSTALLHEVSDIDGAARLVLSLLNDPELRKTMGRAGRAKVERFFSTEASARRLLDLYEECVRLGCDGRTSEP